MPSGYSKLHTFASRALGICARPLLQEAWPRILKQMLLQPGYKEKTMTSLLSGLHHALIIAPHPDDEFLAVHICFSR